MFKPAIRFLASLKLTVFCLGLATILVFAGTFAQVSQGLYQAQENYFQSIFVMWSPAGSDWRIPVYPGGYLLGGILMINLVAGHLSRFGFRVKNLGLWLIHLGLILLLLGQLLTDILSTESAVRFSVGESRNYSEDFYDMELAVILKGDDGFDTVTSIPWSLLNTGATIPLSGDLSEIRVMDRWDNARLSDRPVQSAMPAGATQGVGRTLFIAPESATVRMDERNEPAAMLELYQQGKPLGRWLVSSLLSVAQPVMVSGEEYEIALRSKRHYTPFSLTLLDCQHDIYPGTDIPKNFSSRVRINNPTSGEDRAVLIFMNNPLRYAGLTYYQYQMNARSAQQKTSTLQVVRNPGWLTPYLACILVGLGLLVQFLKHLFVFLRKLRHET